MALRLHKRDDDSGSVEIFSGNFRIGMIRLLHGSRAEPFCWVMSSVLMSAGSSGTAATFDAALAALGARWRRWQKEAELETGVEDDFVFRARAA